MAQFLNEVIQFFNIIIRVIVNTVESGLMFLGIVQDAVQYVVLLPSFLPSFLGVFVLAVISIYVIKLILDLIL